MPSPVRLEHHGLPHALLARWLGDYVRGTPGFQVAVDTTLRLDEGNEFQPDLISFWLGPLPAQLNLGAGDAHESSAKVQDPPSRTASCVYGSRSCHL